MKKLIIFINIIIIIIAFSSISYAENEPIIYSESAILIEASTGSVLFEKNSEERMYPASLTKIMTALIALENCNLKDKAVCSKQAIYNVPSNYSIADIQIGEELTIEQLLNVMLIHSANDAANVVAEHISGSVDEFCKIMNKKAQELGCKNTNFVNANGIQDEQNYSTAYDLALIMNYCVKNPEFVKIISTYNYSLPMSEYCNYDRSFTNNNNLINENDKYFYKYCVGGKTGYTQEAENCLVTLSSKDGLDLIAVVLKGTNTELGESARNVDTINLFNYGYENYNKEMFIVEEQANSIIETTEEKYESSFKIENYYKIIIIMSIGVIIIIIITIYLCIKNKKNKNIDKNSELKYDYIETVYTKKKRGRGRHSI